MSALPNQFSVNCDPCLLTDPFLQRPTPTSIQVVWFTEFVGIKHQVRYEQDRQRTVEAITTKLSRTREDWESKLPPQWQEHLQAGYPMQRDIWRHEAEITGLIPGQRLPYQVVSTDELGRTATSQVFTLAPNPTPGTPLKILLTSDHQLKPMVAANLQKVVETVGAVDAVFLAGDLVNVPDRASEWFDDQQGGAFFPCLQGRATYPLAHEGNTTVYRGGELIQHAPLLTAIGNHEVMGRFSTTSGLDDQFDDAFPRFAALQLQPSAEAANADTTPEASRELKNDSYNTDTYEEIFSLPQSPSGGKQYYAISFGDIRLVVLYITNAWRTADLDDQARGKYRERLQDLEHPENWGHGQVIFEPIVPGSPQYTWLQQELNSPEFRQAKYKIAMFHHPPHSLGGNVVPPYTDPLQIMERDEHDRLKSIRYEYPIAADYIHRHVVPLLEAAGVQLVHYGHCHIWNRFVSPSGMHFLETSNVGNSYGAHVGETKRRVPTDYQETYAASGNPNGLAPVVPTIAPLLTATGEAMPYIASNDITVFSLLETATGTVSSYYFNTRQPHSPVVRFDAFQLKA